MSVETINNLADINNWYELSADKTEYHLLDPTNGSHLVFGAVPQWLEEDPVLGTGLEFLRRRGKNTQVTALYGLHTHRSESSWGYEGYVKDCDYYGFEAYGNTPELISGFQTIARIALQNTDPEDDPDAYTSEYLKELERRVGPELVPSVDDPTIDFMLLCAHAIARHKTEKTSFSYDIQRDSDSPTERLILGKLDEAMECNAEVGVDDAMMLLALEHAHEWIMAARLGVALGEREGIQSDQTLENVLTAGDFHWGLSPKLRQLRADVSSIDACPAPDARNSFWHVEGLYLGTVSRLCLRMLAPILTRERRRTIASAFIPEQRTSIEQLQQEAASLVR